MEIRKLEAILTVLRSARETVELLAAENFPFTDFEDPELGKIFYKLNDMSITIANKIGNMKNKEEN